MCIRPILIPNGSEVACRECWQCRSRKINDWVGRNIAESRTAVASHSITLTYGRDDDGNADHLRAAVLTYSDVQKYLKSLRADGFPLRYFVVGEYGSQKGRAHWHMMAYWQERVPDHDLDKRFEEKHWPHGWSHFELPHKNSIRYVCKYIQKDIGKEERQGHLAMSKKPPLGADYFRDLADWYVENQLAPQDAVYTFDECRDENGKRIPFHLMGRSLDLFLARYSYRWKQVHPDRHPPVSELLEEFEDRQTPEILRLGGDAFYKNRKVRQDKNTDPRRYQPEPHFLMKRYGYGYALDVERQLYYFQRPGGARLVWWQNEKREWTWLDEERLPESLRRPRYGT
jgi:hypothetical protein